MLTQSSFLRPQSATKSDSINYSFVFRVILLIQQAEETYFSKSKRNLYFNCIFEKKWTKIEAKC